MSKAETVQVDMRVQVRTEYIYPIKTDAETARRIKSGKMNDEELNRLLEDTHFNRYWLDEDADFDNAEIFDAD